MSDDLFSPHQQDATKPVAKTAVSQKLAPGGGGGGCWLGGPKTDSSHKFDKHKATLSIEAELYGYDLFDEPAVPPSGGPLADRFVVPPFTVLNAGEGFWQERKRAWIGLGIKSEVGRDAETQCLPDAKGGTLLIDQYRGKDNCNHAISDTGTSIFDPVLCELVYRWFCPEGGQVLDPFAGGSVRGIVAHKMGLRYWGSELRAEQVAANEEQARAICGDAPAGADALTPVVETEYGWVKRDDTCVIHGARGGKARTCWAIAKRATKGLTTAGARHSPQVLLVATMARALGLPCVAHVPGGDISTGPVAAAKQLGTTIVQHSPGYNSLIVVRCREYAQEHGYTEVPFGMECPEAVEETRRQVVNLPPGVHRLVVPVGSGMTLCGILWGLRDIGRTLPIVGVIVGADPTKRMERYAPPDWENAVTWERAGVPYETHVTATWGSVALDPVYEAKCVPFMRHGDLLWVVGHRDPWTCGGAPGPTWVIGDAVDAVPGAPLADLVFTCPPYGDLERYSEDPADLSTMEFHTFIAVYRRIILRSVERLKPNRFAAIVVGNYRDKRTGFYRDLVGETVRAFGAVGMGYYNEALLVTPRGSLPIRITKQFEAGRKLGKTHQNLLVFVKGDARVAARACSAKEGAE